jgi:hypothetical protein
MLKLSLWRMMAAFFLALAVTACGGGAGGSASPPTGFTVTPGNGQAIITWTASPGVQYWLLYAQTATPIDIKNPPSNHAWATNITSPYVLGGLTNGVTYSFAMNARTGGGKGGEQTASVSTVPRVAGANWVAGRGLGTNTMRGITLGISSADSLYYFVAVGDAGKIYKSAESVSQGLNGYNWSVVTPATTIDLNFKAATYTLSKYIAVGSGGTGKNVYTSTDLSTWMPASTTILTGLNALTSNGTTVVAVGDGGKAYYSADGSIWTAATMPTSFTSNLYGVAYSSYTGMWVAVGAGGALLTSLDAISWTSANSGVAVDLNSVTATTGNLIVAAGNSGTVITNNTMTTTLNSDVWTVHTLSTLGGSTPALYAVSTDSVQLLAVGSGGAAFTSTDGATWTTVSSTQTGNDLLAFYGSASKYLAVGTAGANSSSIN